MSILPQRPPDGSSSPLPLVVADATCTACGCLCDDIELTVAEGRVAAAQRACDLGRQWFLSNHDQSGLPAATVLGKPVTPDEAIDEAAAILGKAQAPVILGLTRTANETVAAALALADRLGAAVDVGEAAVTTGAHRAIQRVGRVSATLGEVKNRADVVVFWGADPLATHPRHWERYSVEPRGRFVPDGRAGRTVIVVDRDRTATAARADLFVPIVAEKQFETLWTLRALLGGVALEPGRVEQATGLDLDTLRVLAQRLQIARYGALFHGPSLVGGPGSSACLEAALYLVRDLNRHSRFAILPLGAAGNAAGAEAVLAWQTGWAQSVDFSGTSPRSLAEESSAAARLERLEADAALIVADPVEEWLPAAARATLEQVPRIVIAPCATQRYPTAHVALATATGGIDAAGTVTRVDGVVLPLRPPLRAAVPTDRRWLQALRDRLK
jgi:formylmethanofuran dehydrogenase subunit B